MKWVAFIEGGAHDDELVINVEAESFADALDQLGRSRGWSPVFSLERESLVGLVRFDQLGEIAAGMAVLLTSGD
jgi:hypothetical protein